MPKDYYDILGVEKNASPEQIKRAYRSQAKTIHPDINRSDSANSDFQELINAYTILKQPDKRQLYDSGELDRVEQYAYPDWHDIFNENSSQGGHSHRTHKDYSYTFDYVANRKNSTAVCLGVLIFSLTVMVDFVFKGTPEQQKVIYTKLVEFEKNGIGKRDHTLVVTDKTSFKKSIEPFNQLLPGEIIQVKKSPIYKLTSFKRNNAPKFRSVSVANTIIYITAIIALFFGFIGASSLINPEAKFNSAIIGSFISVLLLMFLVFN